MVLEVVYESVRFVKMHVMILSHLGSHVIIKAHTVDWFLLGIWNVNFKRKIYFRYFVKRDNKTEYLLCHVVSF